MSSVKRFVDYNYAIVRLFFCITRKLIVAIALLVSSPIQETGPTVSVSDSNHHEHPPSAFLHLSKFHAARVVQYTDPTCSGSISNETNYEINEFYSE